MKNKTILFIELYKTHGAPAGLLTELKYLTKYYEKEFTCVVVGHKGSILEQETNKKYIFYSLSDVTDLSNLSRPLSTLWRYIYNLIQIIRIGFNHRIDIIHCNHYVWSIYANPTALLLRRPVIIHLKDTFPLQSFLARGLFRSYPGAKYIAVSEYVRQLFTDDFGVEKKQIVTISDGIDDLNFTPGNLLQIKQKQIAGKKIFILISRIDPERKIEIFIDTAALLLKKYPDFRFVHYGFTSDYKHSLYLISLNQRVKALGIQKSFKFHYYVHDLRKLARIYRKSYLSFVTAPKFALPNVAIESMLCGTPVVAINSGGNPEIIISQKIGSLVAVNSCVAYVKAVEEYLDGLKDYVSVSLLAAEIAKKKFSARKQIHKLIKLYKTMSVNIQSI